MDKIDHQDIVVIILSFIIGLLLVKGYSVLGGIMYLIAWMIKPLKITQFIVLLSLFFHFPMMILFIITWGVVQVLQLPTPKILDGLLIALCFVPINHFFITHMLIFISVIFLLFVMIKQYLSFKYRTIGFVIFGIYLVLGAILPFLKQPKVKEDFPVQYSETIEKAKLIGDNGEALEERIRLIHQAKKEIILSTFEFDADRSGQQMLAALLDASSRGVKISILVDGFPYLKAMAFHPYFLTLSQKENVTIKQYNPISILRPWTFMGRMHDKYLIVDDIGYLLGGRNTYDFFLGNQEGYKNADWDIYVLGNQSLLQIKNYFNKIWNLKECVAVGENSWWKFHPAVKLAENDLMSQYKTLPASWKKWKESGFEPIESIAFIHNPTHIYAKEPIVFQTMTRLMKEAKEEVMIHTPYIICNDDMLEELSQIDHATIMTNSVVNNGNPFGAMDYQMNKGKILATGVSLLEYEQGISYHGKCFTIDDELVGIGSFNWDMRSAYLDTEVMVLVKGKEFYEQCRQAMKVYENDALVVLDEESYLLKEGQKKKELSLVQQIKLKILQILGSWARFLM